jgi:hypothetical protein
VENLPQWPFLFGDLSPNCHVSGTIFSLCLCTRAFNCLLFNDAFQYWYYTIWWNDTWMTNLKDLIGRCHCLIEVLAQHLPRLMKMMKETCQDSQCSVSDSNLAPPKYKSRVFVTSKPNCLVLNSNFLRISVRYTPIITHFNLILTHLLDLFPHHRFTLCENENYLQQSNYNTYMSISNPPLFKAACLWELKLWYWIKWFGSD